MDTFTAKLGQRRRKPTVLTAKMVALGIDWYNSEEVRIIVLDGRDVNSSQRCWPQGKETGQRRASMKSDPRS